MRPVPHDGAGAQGDRGRVRRRVTVGKLNVDENPAIATRFDVLSIPTLLVFSDGQVVKKLVGAMPKKRLVDELSSWL